MKKTLIAIIAIIMLITSMSTVAFAGSYAYPNYEHTPYEGDDFSPEAIYERMIALKEIYPTGTRWSPTARKLGEKGDCGAFAQMLQEAAFGDFHTFADKNLYNNFRTHSDASNIRIGDILLVRNSTGGQHWVIIIDITDGVITIAEGNVAGSVRWGETMTVERWESGKGYRSVYTDKTVYTYTIISRYNKDGTIIRLNRPAATTPAPAETTTPAPALAETAKPAATVQTPAQTVTEIKPATTTNASEFVIVNSSTADKMIVKITNGKAYSNINITTAGSGSGSLNGLTLPATPRLVFACLRATTRHRETAQGMTSHIKSPVLSLF